MLLFCCLFYFVVLCCCIIFVVFTGRAGRGRGAAVEEAMHKFDLLFGGGDKRRSGSSLLKLVKRDVHLFERIKEMGASNVRTQWKNGIARLFDGPLFEQLQAWALGRTRSPVTRDQLQTVTSFRYDKTVVVDSVTNKVKRLRNLKQIAGMQVPSHPSHYTLEVPPPPPLH